MSRAHTTLVLFVLLMILPLPFLPEYGGANSSTRLMLTAAIVDEGASRIDRYAELTVDKALHEGHHYSDKAPGMALLAVPVYAAGRALAPEATTALFRLETPLDELPRVTMLIYRAIPLATGGLLLALAGVALFHMGLRLGGDRWAALMASLSVCLATPVLGWSVQFMGHVGAGRHALSSQGPDPRKPAQRSERFSPPCRMGPAPRARLRALAGHLPRPRGSAPARRGGFELTPANFSVEVRVSKVYYAPRMGHMKTIIRRIAATLPARARASLMHLGFDVARDEFKWFAFLYAKAPIMRFGLEAIRDRGFQPKTIVDVGAFHGEWTRMARAIWPDAEIMMVEANGEKKDLLEAVAKETGAKLEFGLLGPEAGVETEFFVMEAGSSVMEENSPRDRDVEVMKMQTLDNISAFDSVDLLKIDVQGFELEVLKGGAKTLASAQAVLLEVSLLQINKGAPLIAEVLAFMESHGFVAYDVLEVHRRPLDNATNQIDIFFVRKDSPLIANTAHF